jgi:hypothetical protein
VSYAANLPTTTYSFDMPPGEFELAVAELSDMLACGELKNLPAIALRAVNLLVLSLEEADTIDDGYEDGVKDGRAEGYAEGYEDGRIQGFHDGYDDGVRNGRAEGYEKGYDDGRTFERQEWTRRIEAGEL